MEVSLLQEDVTVIIHVPKNRTRKYMKQKLKWEK